MNVNHGFASDPNSGLVTQFTTTAVPEPSSLVLLGFGGALFAWHKLRRARA